MRRIFVHESLTAGPLDARYAGVAGADALAVEGLAMVAALADDLSACASTQVTVLATSAHAPMLGGRQFTVRVADAIEQRRWLFRDLAAGADATFVIAPEINGELAWVCAAAREAGARLFAPPAGAIAICSDKHQTATLWQRRGIPAPHGFVATIAELADATLATVPRGVRFPVVVKPLDGAGGVGTGRQPDVDLWEANPVADGAANRRSITNQSAAAAKQFLSIEKLENINSLRRWAGAHDLPHATVRIESFHLGTPASVAVLVGPKPSSGERQLLPLPGMRQLLSDDGPFRYLGGAGPLPPDQNARAQSLAVRAVSAVLDDVDRSEQRNEASTAAYFGVDLILGEGSIVGAGADAVIEINPRLTTSYVGLRQLTADNIAAALVALSAGARPTLSWRAASVQFDASGKCTLVPHRIT